MIKKIIPYILFAVYTLLKWTWRIDVKESPGLKKLLDGKKPFVVAHWHGEELGIIYLLKRYHVACIVSLSSDGEIMAKVIELFGSKAVRGSSSRGGVGALKGILTLAKKGWRPSVAVDGPKGPRHQVKPGVAEIAKLLKLPIVPISMASSNPFIFEKAWNKSELPKPFSRLQVYWGEPIYLSDGEDAVTEVLPRVAEGLHRGRAGALAILKS